VGPENASQPESVRLFVAVHVPPDELERIERETEHLRSSLGGARWMQRSNQHVTLKFLGRSPVDRVSAIQEVVEIVARSHEPGECRLTQLGAFPTTRRARVLWVGLDDPMSLLPALAGDLDRALEPLGFPAEARPFHPHLTLARFKVPERVEEHLVALTEPGRSFAVTGIDLMRSHLHPRGARYESLRRFPLGRGDLTGRVD
jgi:RNA 2',3'-cyclic 3'-phosphodiesterase